VRPCRATWVFSRFVPMNWAAHNSEAYPIAGPAVEHTMIYCEKDAEHEGHHAVTIDGALFEFPGWTR
jgi:hypothetical protein